MTPLQSNDLDNINNNRNNGNNKNKKVIKVKVQKVERQAPSKHTQQRGYLQKGPTSRMKPVTDKKDGQNSDLPGSSNTQETRTPLVLRPTAGITGANRFDEYARNKSEGGNPPRGVPVSFSKSKHNDYGDYIITKPSSNDSSHHHHHHSDEHQSSGLSLSSSAVSGAGENSTKTQNTASHSSANHSRYHSQRRHKKKKTTVRSIVRGLFVFIALFIAFAIGAFFSLRYLGMSSLFQKSGSLTAPDIEGVVLKDNGYTVEYNGHTYKYNEKVTSILFIGVDKTKLDLIEEKVGTAGQADTLFLAAMDFEKGIINTIAIPRETMVDINEYSESGSFLRTANKQICLAYAYGDGQISSCENLITSVERLFYGLNVNSYLAMDLPGIQALNDAVGGIEVVMSEDMTLDGEFYPAGTNVHLWGKAAEYFVRSRNQTEVDANIDRMARQKIYVDTFMKKVISLTREDMTFPLTLYDTAKSFTISNIDAAKISYLTTELLQNGITQPNITNVPGQSVMGETYAEYHVDEKAFYEQFLNVFYNRID